MMGKKRSGSEGVGGFERRGEREEVFLKKIKKK